MLNTFGMNTFWMLMVIFKDLVGLGDMSMTLQLSIFSFKIFKCQNKP